jgi:hypothetical protein
LRQAATNFREKLASETKQQQRLINLLLGVEIDEFNDYAQQLYQGLFVKPITDILELAITPGWELTDPILN